MVLSLIIKKLTFIHFLEGQDEGNLAHQIYDVQKRLNLHSGLVTEGRDLIRKYN